MLMWIPRCMKVFEGSGNIQHIRLTGGFKDRSARPVAGQVGKKPINPFRGMGNETSRHQFIEVNGQLSDDTLLEFGLSHQYTSSAEESKVAVCTNLICESRVAGEHEDSSLKLEELLLWKATLVISTISINDNTLMSEKGLIGNSDNSSITQCDNGVTACVRTSSEAGLSALGSGAGVEGGSETALLSGSSTVRWYVPSYAFLAITAVQGTKEELIPTFFPRGIAEFACQT
ncbi:hypothetical protein DFJ73DRAFT_755546 [Zopfochytrium polystomum]|nr:hypothetical protein DFJ73DRAFT_755546 [Zopfochytrium polystomum]